MQRASRARLPALAVPLLGLGGWLVLRDSALFSVDHVSDRGALAPTPCRPSPTSSMAAARAQTTTDFSAAALRAAVARYTLIDELRARRRTFPHGVADRGAASARRSRASTSAGQ